MRPLPTETLPLKERAKALREVLQAREGLTRAHPPQLRIGREAAGDKGAELLGHPRPRAHIGAFDCAYQAIWAALTRPRQRPTEQLIKREPKGPHVALRGEASALLKELRRPIPHLRCLRSLRECVSSRPQEALAELHLTLWRHNKGARLERATDLTPLVKLTEGSQRRLKGEERVLSADRLMAVCEQAEIKGGRAL